MWSVLAHLARPVDDLAREAVERGKSGLSEPEERRLRRVIDRGNRGSMLRAAAFVDPDGPKRWRLRGVAL